MGEPVSNWYGLDLVTGQEIKPPARLAHKMVPPLFVPVDDEPEPEIESDATEDDAPRRRGRPRKV